MLVTNVPRLSETCVPSSVTDSPCNSAGSGSTTRVTSKSTTNRRYGDQARRIEMSWVASSIGLTSLGLIEPSQ